MLAFDIKMIFHSHATKTHFHKKDSALFLVFKVRDSFSVFRVRLGHLSSFLSTSCITSLHFIPDSDQGKWYFSVINFRFYFLRLPIPVFHLPGGGERRALPYLAYADMCYVHLDIVFRVLSLTLGMQFHY